MVPLTRVIGEFVAGMRFDAIPDAAIAIARNGFTDYAGTTILGRTTPVVKVLKSVCSVAAQGGEARVCFGAEGARTVDAALINGTSGHALDYDDIGIGAHPAHPSVAMAPAIFAEAEVLGATGRDMLTAYMTGYEVWGEIARRDRQQHSVKGWHATGTFGAIAAAAAVSKLRGLDARKASHAIGLAASQACGLVGNFGSMAKPFHAGNAARIGVLSARLAESGMTAAPDIIEKAGGFLHAVSPAGEVDCDSPEIFGREWWMLRHGLGFKLYPVCYGAHRSLAGMLELIAEHPFSADEVKEVHVVMGRGQMASLVNHDPKNGLDAKFSEEFVMAMAIMARRASLAEVADEFVARPDVRALMSKVRITTVDEVDPEHRTSPVNDRVSVLLKDGRTLERRFGHPRGHPARPIGRDDLWAKFSDCTSAAMAPPRARLLFDQLQALESVQCIAELPLTDGDEH